MVECRQDKIPILTPGYFRGKASDNEIDLILAGYGNGEIEEFLRRY